MLGQHQQEAVIIVRDESRRHVIRSVVKINNSPSMDKEGICIECLPLIRPCIKREFDLCIGLRTDPRIMVLDLIKRSRDADPGRRRDERRGGRRTSGSSRWPAAACDAVDEHAGTLLPIVYFEQSGIHVFDEGAADQDMVFREFFDRTFLPRLKSLGRTSIVVSQNDRYFHLADKVMQLENGWIWSATHNAAAAPHRHETSHRIGHLIDPMTLPLLPQVSA